jgi:hypothetical protein
MTPLLEIVTRCYKRPVMLAANQASLARQTDHDWRQTLLVDDVGIGVPAANALLADFTPTGRYVWVLDDDDLCTYPEMVYDLRMLEMWHNPDAVFVRFDHGWIGILPDAHRWRKQPDRGRIGGSSVIVRSDLWMQCRDAWRSGLYESDFDYVQTVYRAATNPHWHDVIAGKVQRISQGEPE